MKKCANCREEVEFKIVPFRGTVKGQRVDTYIEEYRCRHCGAKYIDYETDQRNIKRVYEQYKHDNGLLSSSQLVRIRTKLGWTERRMADYLGIDTEELEFYENGAVQLRIIDDHIRGLAKKYKISEV